MKKLHTILALLLLSLCANASPVSKELAKKVAINFLGAKQGTPFDPTRVSNVYTHFHEGKEAFYVFAFPRGGFVIVAADDEANPIIGYSPTSPATESIDNPVILGRFDWYAKQVSHAAKSRFGKSSVKAEWEAILEGREPKGSKAVGPLLNTTWNQEPYYNALCPTGTPTGCVATAMSQIMKHHGWPASGNGSYQYTHATYGLQSANFGSATYSWADMPNALTASSTEAQKNAVATICYHAGVSVNMNYSTDGSGAFSQNVLYALTSYFKYDPTSINIYIFDANQHADWLNLVRAEIDANRPVYYAGSSKKDGGHAWVCDGYDDNGKLHMNWGWGGAYNGFYSATAINPGTYNFSENSEMITGIKPGGEKQSMLWVKQNSAFNAESRGIRSIAAVDNSIAWAVAFDGSRIGSKVRDFTKTTNGGQTWSSGTIATAGAEGLEFSMITAVNENTAWVAMFDGTNSGGKILRTTDGGTTWVHQPSAAFTAPDGFPNVVHFWDENSGFCMGDPNGGYFEIYTTSNGGSTWTRVPQANIPNNLSKEYGTVGLYAVFGNTVWFATNKGRIFKSTNRGNTWVVHQTPLSESFAISFKDENTGVIQSRGEEAVESYRTTNGGASWEQISPTGNFYTADFTYIPNTNILVSSGSDFQTPFMGLSYSLDDGNTFSDYADFYRNYQFLSLGASPGGAVWAGGFNMDKNNDGIWYLNPGTILSRFSASKAKIEINKQVEFSDQSLGEPEAWEWNFGTSATPQTATGKGPHTVTYTEYGYKTVTLTITKGTDQYVSVNSKAVFVDWIAGVDKEQATAGKHYLYPNPANSEQYITIKGFEKGHIQVYSIAGTLMWQSAGTTHDSRVNIGLLPSGIYIVRIGNADGSAATRKLVISR